MHFSDYKAEKFDGNTTCQDFLPYYSYIPFGVETKSRCKWAFFFMDIPLDFLAWYIAAHDGNFVAILNCLKTQLLILCGAFTSIRERTLMKLNLPPNYEVFHDEENPILEAALYAEMKHCTIHLMLLLNVCQEVEKIFNFVTLAQTLASLLIFASCLFVATSVPMTSPIFFSQLEYFVAVLIQLSTFCWFGNEMSSASEAIRNALYESKWLSTSRRFRLSMMLNICRMQRQVYVSIGKFSPLTLVTLVSVMRGSFSYFAVFKNVQN